jgi:hypothetical protein
MSGAVGFGLSATDGGLRPPPPSSVAPIGIPALPTADPGPIEVAMGPVPAGPPGPMAAQVPDVLAFIPPPSNSVVPYPPVIEVPMPADAPAAAPPHVAPGLTPGVASSVAPKGIPVCPIDKRGPIPSGEVKARDAPTCA